MNQYRILVINPLNSLLENKSFSLENGNCAMDIIPSSQLTAKTNIEKYHLLLLGITPTVIDEAGISDKLYEKTSASGIPVFFFTERQLCKMNTNRETFGPEQYMALWRQIGCDL